MLSLRIFMCVREFLKIEDVFVREANATKDYVSLNGARGRNIVGVV